MSSIIRDGSFPFNLSANNAEGIGRDIKEVFTEFGIPYTIIDPLTGEEIAGEYLDYKANTQVTKPFIREFFLEAQLTYDTQVTAGAVIRLNPDGRLFLVMNATPELFEQLVVVYNAVLYKCNEVVTLLRQTQPAWTDSYTQASEWEVVHDEVPVLLTEKLYGTALVAEHEWAEFGVNANELYISGQIDIQPKDRIKLLNSDEQYKVEVVERRKFDNVSTCSLTEDTRE